MSTKIERKHVYKQFPKSDRRLVDFAIEYADTYRNREYIYLLIQFGEALLQQKWQTDWKFE